MSSFSENLAAAKAKRETEPDTRLVEIAVNGSLVVLKFTELPALEWAKFTLRNPPRPDVRADVETYGYNVQGACRDAAPHCGVRVEDGVDVPFAVTRDKKGMVTHSEWDDLFSVISGHEFGLIADAIWHLNEWGPQQRVADAKKASTGDSVTSLTLQ